MTLSLPVPTGLLAEWLPHRPPMVWIDDVVSFGDNGGEARIRLRAEAHYMGPEGLRPSALVEFIAQSFGFMSICQNLAASQVGTASKSPLKKAFLAGFRDVEWSHRLSEAPLRDGCMLLIRIGNIKTFGPIQSFDGKVFMADSGEEIASAKLKVFSE